MLGGDRFFLFNNATAALGRTFPGFNQYTPKKKVELQSKRRVEIEIQNKLVLKFPYQ